MADVLSRKKRQTKIWSGACYLSYFLHCVLDLGKIVMYLYLYSSYICYTPVKPIIVQITKLTFELVCFVIYLKWCKQCAVNQIIMRLHSISNVRLIYFIKLRVHTFSNRFDETRLMYDQESCFCHYEYNYFDISLSA